MNVFSKQGDYVNCIVKNGSLFCDKVSMYDLVIVTHVLFILGFQNKMATYEK